MIARYINILSVYFRNPPFIALSSVFLGALFFAKGAYIRDLYSLAEDLFTLIFVISVWLAFFIGTLIKRQFANHRASLLPGYRVAHVGMACLLFSIFVGIVCWWREGIDVLFLVTPQEYAGISMLCLFIYIFIAYIGYLSIGTVVFLAYFSLLLAAGQTQMIIGVMGQYPVPVKLLLALSVGMGVLFICRLMTLKEDMLEYPFLFTWPQKEMVRNQLRAGGIISPLVSFVRSALGLKEAERPFPPYPAFSHLMARAWHWDSHQRDDMFHLMVLLGVLTPFYLLYIKANAGSHKFFLNPYANFLVFAAAPVLVTVCDQSRKLAYWGHDLLKPVGRERFLLEKGGGLLGSLAAAWLFFAVYFAVLPGLVLRSGVWREPAFLPYLIFTGCFAFLLMAWTALMATLTSPAAVIVHGVFVCALMQVHFMCAADYSVGSLWGQAGFSLAAALVLSRLAYRRWGRMEFK